MAMTEPPVQALPQARHPITLLGAGAWGTALAICLHRNGCSDLRLWTRDPEQAKEMQKSRYNQNYLADTFIPKEIKISDDLNSSLQNSQHVIVTTPSFAVLETMEQIAAHYAKLPPPWVCIASKGLEPKSLKFLHQTAQETLPKGSQIAVLSGPSFAREVASNKPTAVALAGQNHEVIECFTQLFHQPTFRIYPTFDLIGVQLGGIAKNVLAIAAGIADGMELGSNARAALLTRGLAEMLKLGQAMGAQQETLIGLAGIGDLILTCCDNQSRNRRYGLAIGRGATPDQASKEIHQIIEGKENTECLYRLAIRYQQDLPIITQIYLILQKTCTPEQALQHLLHRQAHKI